MPNSPKKQKKNNYKETPHMSELMHDANLACENIDGTFSPKTDDFLNKVKEWIGVSTIGIASPLISLTSFFLVRETMIIKESGIKQPVTFWGVNVNYPGMKKTPLHKHFDDNLDMLKLGCKRDHIERDLGELNWGGGTTEAMKKTISEPISDGCLIMFLNEFNSFLEDMDKHSNSCGDSTF